MRNPYPDFTWFVGTAEDTSSDPLRLGRVRVRAVGFHPSSTASSDLPLAYVLDGGAVRISTGQMVIGFFMDGEEAQQPCILGTIGGAVISKEVFNKSVKTVETKSVLDRAIDAVKELFVPAAAAAETPPPRSAVLGGLYIGDSIAVGLGTAAKQTVNATVGMNSTNILKNYSGKSGSSYTVISAGTNDQSGEPTESNIRKLRASINSPKVVFIVPFTKQQNGKPTAAVIANMQKAALAVRKVAAEKGDIIIELDKYKSNDGLHPSQPSIITKDIETLVGKPG